MMTLFLAKDSWINGCSHFGLKCKCFQNKVRCLFSPIWLLLHIPTFQGIFRHSLLKKSSQRVPNQSSLMDFSPSLLLWTMQWDWNVLGCQCLLLGIPLPWRPSVYESVRTAILGDWQSGPGSLSPLLSTEIQERTWFLIEVFQTACCWGYTLAGSTGGFVKVILSIVLNLGHNPLL